MPYTSPKFNGEPSAAALANGLATLGRYGDSYMVHASDGETIIPGEILAANPSLKADLFNQMKVMGIRDPDRYVVGNSLNSINPITGQPEFFFKKIFKTVKNVFKKALPYVAPIVGNMIAPGIGGIIASGLVSKLQGGSWGDVAKDMAISYGVGALGQGLTSSKGFMTGLGEGLEAPWHAGKALFGGGPKNPLAQGIFGTGKTLDLGLGFSGGPTAQQTAFGSETLGDIFPTYQKAPMPFSQQHIDSPTKWPNRAKFPLEQRSIAASEAASELSPAEAEMRYRGVTGTSLAEQAAAERGAQGLGLDAPQAQMRVALPSAAADAGQAATTPSTILGSETAARLVEQAAIPGLIAGLTYFLSEDDDELTPDQARALSDPQRFAYDQYLEGRQADPNFKDTPEGQQLLAQAGIVPSTDPQTLADATGASLEQAQNFITNMYGNQFTMLGASALGQPLTAPGQAKGGIVTLQGGGEIMGPGSGISDSIPARLSDGEFVMTADAVRGAGNGSRDMGAARMYDLMSRFERAA